MALDFASTALIMICTALVQLMTPGLAFFYGGLVKETSVLTMMMQVIVPMGIISVLWYMVLFSLCFGESVGFFGNPGTYIFSMHVSVNEALVREGEIFVDGIPGLLFMAYQGMFAVITPALMTGAFADRFRFKAYIIFIVLWMVLVYCPFCHWVWGGGWMAEWGVWDFAGGIVVHITAGFSALATILIVGKREVAEGEDLDEPHNIPFVALGTALLWFGWFGFNGGSALGIDSSGVAVTAAVNSEIAASVALLVWILIDWYRFGRPKLVGLCVGAIAGLATVTPAAGFIQPWAAFLLGIAAACCCYACCEVRKWFDMDDALDVWGVHGMGGLIGTVLLGILADDPECAPEDGSTAPSYCVNPGTITGSQSQLGKQIVAAFFCAFYSFVATVVMLVIIDRVVPLLPQKSGLRAGKSLDLHEHGELAYGSQKFVYPATGADDTAEAWAA